MEILKPGRLFWALSMAALLATGCGDDDDDGDGGNSVGPSGDGTVITADNAGEVQSVVFTNIGNVAAKGPGTHKGAVSGKVKIELGGLGKAAQIDVGNIGGVDVGSLQFNYSMDFDNFSDDGELWYDGIVSYEVAGTNFNYVFDVTVSGAYSGTIKGQVSLQNGVYSGSWDLGNGQVYSF